VCALSVWCVNQLKTWRQYSSDGQGNITYFLTPWYRVLLDKLTGLKLVKKFPAFHGTRRFITALTSVRHSGNIPNTHYTTLVTTRKFYHLYDDSHCQRNVFSDSTSKNAQTDYNIITTIATLRSVPYCTSTCRHTVHSPTISTVAGRNIRSLLISISLHGDDYKLFSN